jgi:hypothetical protein
MSTTRMHRRTALRGLGLALALPLLERMGWADEPRKAGKAPLRMAHITFPNGAIREHWRFTPNSDKVPRILEPLKPHLRDVLVLHGINHTPASPGPDGAGDHARGIACLLTGVRVKKGGSTGIYTGTSVDQAACQRLGQYTSLPSIELSIEGSNGAGSCDDGYSCVYTSSTSWRSPTTPMAKETVPKNAFMRLFADRNQSQAAQAQAALAAENASLLDLVNSDAKSLRGELGGNDVRKLDEYLEAVRALESRIQKISGHEEDAGSGVKNELKLTPGVPKDFSEHARMMYDILTLAFQTDTTRFATFMLGNGASYRSYPEIGVPNPHHELSHRGTDAAKIEGLVKILNYQVAQFAYFLERLKAVKEGRGTLLDNCMLFYGSGMGDGDKHDHNDLPIVVAGGGGGTIRTGRVVQQCRGELADLHLAFLLRLGLNLESFGASRAPMPDLS